MNLAWHLGNGVRKMMHLEPKQLTLEEAKTIFASKTFWGAVVTLIVTLDPSLIAKFAAGQDLNAAQAIIVAKCIALSGIAFTIYGRFAATKVVTLSGKPKELTSVEVLQYRIDRLEEEINNKEDKKEKA